MPVPNQVITAYLFTEWGWKLLCAPAIAPDGSYDAFLGTVQKDLSISIFFNFSVTFIFLISRLLYPHGVDKPHDRLLLHRRLINLVTSKADCSIRVHLTKFPTLLAFHNPPPSAGSKRFVVLSASLFEQTSRPSSQAYQSKRISVSDSERHSLLLSELQR